MKTNYSLKFYYLGANTELQLPYADLGVSAGFGSPAQNYLNTINLNEKLIQNPPSTYLAEVVGDSMVDVNLYDGDLLFVDQSLKNSVKNGDMVVCSVDGDFFVKFFKREGDVIWLVPANEKYRPIKVTAENDFTIFGVVVGSYTDRRYPKRRII